MRKPIVIGNWKLNGQRDLIADFAARLDSASGHSLPDTVTTAICVPAVYLPIALQSWPQQVWQTGVQDVSEHDAGAFTGEVSAAMLADVGATMALVGHSERRQYHHESNEQVASKAQQLLAHQLTAVVCVGETLSERQQGQTEDVVARQLQAVLDLEPDDADKLIVAYEPVWAIGTGETATPEQAQAVHQHLRQVVANHDPELAEKLRIIYGGSVKPDNAQALLSQPDIDGGLIGGAALKVDSFVAIINAAKPNAAHL